MPFVPLWRMVLLCFDRGFQADSLVYLFAYAAIETQDSFFDIHLAGCIWNVCSILVGRGLVASPRTCRRAGAASITSALANCDAGMAFNRSASCA